MNMMMKIYLFLIMGIMLGSCKKEVIEYIPVSTILLNNNNIELERDKSFQLIAFVNPSATERDVSWTSLNKEIAIVDDTGLVIAKAAGTTAIVAKSGDRTIICKVTVIKEKIVLYPSASYELSEDKKILFLWKGDEEEINMEGDDNLKAVETISAHAFEQSKISKIIIGNKVKTIESYAFYGLGNLKTIQFGNSLKVIGGYAFTYTGLSGELDLAAVEFIGESSFAGCGNISAISFPKSNFSIGPFAFNQCQGVTELLLPAGLQSIDVAGFANCGNIKSIHFENGALKHLHDWMFYKNYQLESVVLPASLESMGKEVFIDCTSLKNIVLPVTIPPNVGSDVFGNVPVSKCQLLVPYNSILQYRNHLIWGQFLSIVALPQ